MRVFVSYARKDRAAVDPLVRDIERLGHQVWLDQELTGGQDWWNTILAYIRGADVIITALSPDWMASEACARELSYATATNRHLLPVMLRSGVSLRLLPPHLAQSQHVDYVERTADASIALARALGAVSPALSLPNPLPQPPEVPISYLTELRTAIQSPQQMSREQQLDVLARLKMRLATEDERVDVMSLLADFRRRPDLLALVAADIDTLTAGRAGAALAPPRIEPLVAPVPVAVAPAAPPPQTPPAPPPAAYVPSPMAPAVPGAAWPTGAFVGYIVLALFCGLAGVIVGALNLKHPARKGQATVVLIVGVAVMVLGFLAVAASNSATT